MGENQDTTADRYGNNEHQMYTYACNDYDLHARNNPVGLSDKLAVNRSLESP